MFVQAANAIASIEVSMLQPRICRPTKAIEPPLASLIASLYALSLRPRPLHSTFIQTTTFVRHASHASQGRANGPKDSAGRRLGAKKSASEYVIPGNIIFKQRGHSLGPGHAALWLMLYRHKMVPRRERRHGQRPHNLRHSRWLRSLLQRPYTPPEAAVCRSRVGTRRTSQRSTHASKRSEQKTAWDVRSTDQGG